MLTSFKNIIPCVFLLFVLGGCKVEFHIFGIGTVQSASGTIDCTSDGTTQSGDCTQTYNVDENNDACDPETDDDCTIVTDTITETYVATPLQDDTFDGFTGHCPGAGPCNQVITESQANADQAVTAEVHFDPEAVPQDATYTYNYLNQRVSKTVNSVTTYFIYDEQGNLLSEVDASGNSIKDYIYMDGEYVAYVEKTGDTSLDEWGDPRETQEQVFYPINDHLGQPFIVFRADTRLSHEQYTNPFGQMHAQFVDTSIGTGPLRENVRFPGQYYDLESGYSYNWNRYYDPSTSYTQSDPIGLAGGINTYGYAYQNPINYWDFMGLTTEGVCESWLRICRGGCGQNGSPSSCLDNCYQEYLMGCQQNSTEKPKENPTVGEQRGQTTDSKTGCVYYEEWDGIRWVYKMKCPDKACVDDQYQYVHG